MPLKIFTTSHEEIEKAVLYWIELLSEEKYEEAYELTLHDPYYQWTPANIKSVVNGYGLPDDDLKEKYKVTSAATATNEINLNLYKDITFFPSPIQHAQKLPHMIAIGDIHYDLPINGKWSDLTASFTIFQEDDFLMLQLNEIHVL